MNERSTRRTGSPGPALAAVFTAGLLASAAAAPREGDHGAAVQRMIRPVLTAGETVADVRIERSDPFGGHPERERGRLWYLPGRGIRYRSEARQGQDVIVDRARDAFQLYSAAQRVVYRGPFERAPTRLKALVLHPDDLLSKPLLAVPERRRIGGAERAGYRLRDGALGDSLREWSVWIAGDSKTGLPRWVSIASDIDTLSIEFERFTMRSTARPGDLALDLPPGTKVESLDARELFQDHGQDHGQDQGQERGEGAGRGESR